MDEISDDFFGLHELGIATEYGLSSFYQSPRVASEARGNAKGPNAAYINLPVGFANTVISRFTSHILVPGRTSATTVVIGSRTIVGSLERLCDSARGG